MFVAGMHRSGTSATTGMLTRLGLNQSKNVLPEHLFNPGGHFESLELFHANESILHTLGYAWDLPPIAPLAETELNHIRECSLLDELRTQFQAKSITRDWCDKDPRLAITLPVWDQILIRKVPVIACVRNPNEVAMSLRLREGMPLELGVILWRLYNENLRNSCQQRECLLLDYELDLKTETTKAVQKIYRFAVECGYTPRNSNLNDAASVFKSAYHRNRTPNSRTTENNSDTSQRLQNALAIYERIRQTPIHEWPAELEESTQIREEDAQWLMLYRKSKIRPMESKGHEAISSVAASESRWPRLAQDPIGVIKRKLKALASIKDPMLQAKADRDHSQT